MPAPSHPTAFASTPLIGWRHRPKLWLRVQLGRLMHARLQRRAAPLPTRNTATSLVIAPHPDDEVLGCGGLIAHLVAGGESVHIVYLTDGSASHPGHPVHDPASIAHLRTEEARRATGLLGVPEAQLTFMHAPDGQLPHLPPALRTGLIQRLQLLISQLRPDQVLVTARTDGSSEHTAAQALTEEALAGLPAGRPRLLEYLVWSRWSPRLLQTACRAPATVFRHALSPREAGLKHDALGVFRSQFAPLPPWTQPVLPPGFAQLFQAPEEYFLEFPH
ncbi:glucosamine-6-phosphate deaminase-like protein [Lacunisphaera limnophila]|uniref:Glucosamine-6-phosphate deaminase-like protein n=1 Tax=Lacunisphaera limnophila TaxID=1838286 RepID=A0A1D8AXY9_9BACT|nr:PIG-L family deacetylase [Lacunisphaera limnophila]AOS45737.1 glucosamine-6-phosphate deaminase-like protein [Lacunisphaera limnophila]